MKLNKLKEMMMKKIIACLVSCLIIFGIAGCTLNGADKKVKMKKDVAIIGMKSGPMGFHPWIENYETVTMNVNSNVFNAIVEFDSLYRIVPALAQTWENPNRLTWRFHLRRGVKFHNGDNFTSRDVKYTIDSIKADEKSVFKDLLTQISEVVIVDDYTVDIRTEKPFPILLNKLADIFIVSEKYQRQNNSKLPIGTGAYKFVEYIPGEYTRMERFDDYWGQKGTFQYAVFRIIEDDDERLQALLEKRIDIAEVLALDKVDKLKQSEGVDASLLSTIRVIYLAFDMRENDSYAFPDTKNPVSDLRVRKAIYHAIDEDKIIYEIMNDLADPATQFLSPNIFGYNPKIKRLPHDLRLANQLMREAGYENGFEIELDCPNNRYVNDEAICQEVVKQLAKIKIKVKLNAQPKAKFFPKVLTRKTSFYLLGWSAATADGGEIFDYLLRTVNAKDSIGTYNLGYYSNPEVDRIGSESSQIIESSLRLELMQKGFKIAMDDVVWVPLHLQQVLYGKSSDIDWEPRLDVRLKAEEIKVK